MRPRPRCGPEVDEFELSGLTPIASELIKPARVAESHVHMECRLLQVVQVSDQPGGGSLVLGEVLRFHVREDMIEDFRIDPDKLRAVGPHGRFDLRAHHRSLRPGDDLVTMNAQEMY